MIYDISLTISYDYDAPSHRSRNLFRLLPPDRDGYQRVLSRLLTVDPWPSERHDGADFFGNATTSAFWHDPLDAFSVTLKSRIERLSGGDELNISPTLEGLEKELAANRDLSPNGPHHFTAPSRRATPWAELTSAVQSWIRPGMTTQDVVVAVGEALNREMRFDAKATDVDTSAETAFANRHGVCQDFSHIMIAGLRGIGVPAGYVSGFLRTDPPPGRPRLEGADAMHAWVRAWAGSETGWIEYDPTNARMSGSDHILLGYGRDYDDVAPVRGAMRGMGGQTTSQAVDVVPAGV